LSKRTKAALLNNSFFRLTFLFAYLLMKVVYYTSSYFFDTAIEIINILKAEVELHVLVEVTPSSRAATILSIPQLPDKPALLAPEKLLSPESIGYRQHLFCGTFFRKGHWPVYLEGLAVGVEPRSKNKAGCYSPGCEVVAIYYHGSLPVFFQKGIHYHT
jgi:hypothetical protein